MSTCNAGAPRNVYVNIDAPLPASLKLKVGQSLIFVRAFSCAGYPFLRSLNLPAPCFVAANDINYDTTVPGQPARTFIVGLGLVHSGGDGEILLRFAAGSNETSARTVRLKFTIRG